MKEDETMSGPPAEFTNPENREKILDILDDYMDFLDAVRGDQRKEKENDGQRAGV